MSDVEANLPQAGNAVKKMCVGAMLKVISGSLKDTVESTRVYISERSAINNDINGPR